MNSNELFTDEGLRQVAHRLNGRLVFESMFDPGVAGGRGAELEFAAVVDTRWPRYRDDPVGEVRCLFASAGGGQWLEVPPAAFIGLTEAVEEHAVWEAKHAREAS
jgi:hypothetical protein